MSNEISEDCSTGLHEYCTPCNCMCHRECICAFTDRIKRESERDWLKRCMCQAHWMQTNYYRAKLTKRKSEK